MQSPGELDKVGELEHNGEGVEWGKNRDGQEGRWWWTVREREQWLDDIKAGPIAIM
jgi:hypothetical protein